MTIDLNVRFIGIAEILIAISKLKTQITNMETTIMSKVTETAASVAASLAVANEKLDNIKADLARQQAKIDDLIANGGLSAEDLAALTEISDGNAALAASLTTAADIVPDPTV